MWGLESCCFMVWQTYGNFGQPVMLEYMVCSCSLKCQLVCWQISYTAITKKKVNLKWTSFTFAFYTKLCFSPFKNFFNYIVSLYNWFLYNFFSGAPSWTARLRFSTASWGRVSGCEADWARWGRWRHNVTRYRLVSFKCQWHSWKQGVNSYQPTIPESVFCYGWNMQFFLE